MPASVIICITEHGGKELVVTEDAYRKSEVNFAKLLNGLVSAWLNHISLACYRRRCHCFLEFNCKDIPGHAIAPTLLTTSNLRMENKFIKH
ncbi:MAG: hypothetical protein ACTS73_09035 [Arsenophonus sp. NEOnobi-MAG3]